MSLKHAILGLLEVNPMSGYELKRYFDSSINSYWPATHSQIYRTLDELAKDGFLIYELIQQDKNPNKKIFSITDKGRQELASWLIQTKKLPSIRHQILLQFSLSQQLDKEEILELIKTYKYQLEEKIAILTSPQHAITLDYARDEKERLIWELTLDNGIMFYNNEIEWANRCEKIINIKL